VCTATDKVNTSQGDNVMSAHFVPAVLIPCNVMESRTHWLDTPTTTSHITIINRSGYFQLTKILPYLYLERNDEFFSGNLILLFYRRDLSRIRQLLQGVDSGSCLKYVKKNTIDYNSSFLLAECHLHSCWFGERTVN
jgi:hypothetical protein